MEQIVTPGWCSLQYILPKPGGASGQVLRLVLAPKCLQPAWLLKNSVFNYTGRYVSGHLDPFPERATEISQVVVGSWAKCQLDEEVSFKALRSF